MFWSLMEWLGWNRKPLKKKKKKKKKKVGVGAAARTMEMADGARTMEVAAPSKGRKPVGLEAFCRSVAAVKDDPWPARVRDLSSGSIGLLLTRRFEPGTLLVIELEKKAASLSHTLVGRVVHATQYSAGGWMVGCTLANKIAEEDLQALLL
jgi:hypothetical protein